MVGFIVTFFSLRRGCEFKEERRREGSSRFIYAIFVVYPCFFFLLGVFKVCILVAGSWIFFGAD
jgi:hypothetical protein